MGWVGGLCTKVDLVNIKQLKERGSITSSCLNGFGGNNNMWKFVITKVVDENISCSGNGNGQDASVSTGWMGELEMRIMKTLTK